MSDNIVLSSGIADSDKNSFLKKLVESGGPELHDYEKFTSLIDNLNPARVEDFREILLPVLNENTLIKALNE